MEKYYYELSVTPDSYYELFLDLVASLTQDAIEEDNGTIIIRSTDTLDDLKDGIEAFRSELSLAFNTTIKCKTSVEKKENQDWIKLYQQSVKPIEVDKFYIHPSWDTPKDGKINITIDPTLAFGSGHHETTNSCLKAISKYVKANMKVCDVGCGSGILSIGAAKLDATTDICDTDEEALKDAIKNFQTNGMIPHKSWVGSANETCDTYDVVIANIVADVLVFISKDLKKITKDDGIIILSGIMQQHKQKVLNKFKEFEILEIIQQNEWVTIIIKKVNDGKSK